MHHCVCWPYPTSGWQRLPWHSAIGLVWEPELKAAEEGKKGWNTPKYPLEHLTLSPWEKLYILLTYAYQILCIYRLCLKRWPAGREISSSEWTKGFPVHTGSYARRRARDRSLSNSKTGRSLERLSTDHRQWTLKKLHEKDTLNIQTDLYLLINHNSFIIV